MLLPTQNTLSQLFTNLVGRPVTFTRLPAQEGKSAKPLYATYRSSPDNGVIVLKIDFALLGSCAGALLGIPEREVRARLAGSSMDEVFQDATAEVLNITSSVLCKGERTVYAGMTTDAASLDPDARETLAKPSQKLMFMVSIPDYQGGPFTLFF